MSQCRVFFESIKIIVAGSIGDIYQDVGSPTTHMIRCFKISNNTLGDMMFTTDGVNDQIFVPAGAFTLYDLQSNINPKHDDQFVLSIGTQFQVKQITAPVSGAIYIECIY